MKMFAVAAIATTMVFAVPVQAQTSVAANQASVTDLGFFQAGTYNITGSGLIDLVGPVGSGFTMRPDGIPDSPVTASGYGYFNPNGSYLADGNFGPGGTTAKIGALMGSLTATPGATDWFLIGYGTTITLSSAGNIYAQVNDTFYSNNGGSYLVNVAAVPETATWAMMIVGFGMVGGTVRYRRRNATTSYA